MFTKKDQNGYTFVRSTTMDANGKNLVMCNNGGQVVVQNYRSSKFINYCTFTIKKIYVDTIQKMSL